jgi:hypothetical protein
MRDLKFTMHLDAQTHEALQKLANANERSMAAEIRLMIKQAAIAKGLWGPKSLRAIRS